jgi:hypothetical protein
LVEQQNVKLLAAIGQEPSVRISEPSAGTQSVSPVEDPLTAATFKPILGTLEPSNTPIDGKKNDSDITDDVKLT